MYNDQVKYWMARYEGYETKALRCKYNMAVLVEQANRVGPRIPESVLTDDQQNALLDWKQLIDSLEPDTQLDVIQPAFNPGATK